MSARLKPIDAIKNAFYKQGYNFGKDDNRKDICIKLNLSLRTSYKKLCELAGAEYLTNNHGVSFHYPQMIYLISVDNPSHRIKFESLCKMFHSLLIRDRPKSCILNNFITNQYVQYNGESYIISDRLRDDITPNYNSPYNLINIRQELKRREYDVDVFTSQKDICEMLGLQRCATKKRICDKLGIRYFKIQARGRGYRPKVVVRLTNINDPTHTNVFESATKSAIELNIQICQVNTYINSPTFTVGYFGEIFRLSYVYE